MKTLPRFFGLCLMLFSSLSMAREALVDWWFEIEVLAFTYQRDISEVTEQVPQNIAIPRSQRALNVIEAHMRPNVDVLRTMLPLCDMPPDTGYSVEVATTSNDAESDDIAMALDDAFVTNDADSNNQDQRDIDWQPHAFFQTPPWQRLGCVYQQEAIGLTALVNPLPDVTPSIEAIPALIDGIERPFSEQPYLLDRDSLKFHTLAGKLRYRADVEPLLHFGWRQEVQFGENRARPIRIMGGQNFTDGYDQAGFPLPDEQPQNAQHEVQAAPPSLMDKVDTALAQPLQLDPIEAPTGLGEPIDERFELDGLLKVYLKYLNRVPYLHIETDVMFHRVGPMGLMETLNEHQWRRISSHTEGLPAERLYAFPMQQRRRVVSSQLHYFDHPMVGLVIEIRRFTKPKQDEQSDSAPQDNTGNAS